MTNLSTVADLLLPPKTKTYHILFLALLKTFFSPFPKCPTSPYLFTKNKLKNYFTMSIKNFEITRILTKLNFIPLPVY